MRHRGAIIAAIAVAAAGGTLYAISPYFTEITVDEPLPDVIMMDEAPGAPMAGMPMASLSGMFVGVGDGVHDARGTAKVLERTGGGQVLRLEDFFSTNGPELHVYLSADTSDGDYVDLGLLKGNRGDQNYDIPEGTDLSRLNNVLIWCKPFGVLFGSAELA